MARILILDGDHDHRAELLEGLRRTSNADAVVVDTDAELISRVQYGIYEAVFADAELLKGNHALLVEAVRTAITRPMLIVASNERHRDLDGDLVTLIVRKPYDVAMVTGILLSAILGMPRPDAAGGDPTIRKT